MISNGQNANQTNFNNAFLSKTDTSAANSTTGIVGLKNTSDVNSGAIINNPQRLINEIADASGVASEGDTNRKVYSSNNIVANGDNRKVAIGKLDAEFDATTGHTHDGSPGSGGPISASALSGFNQYFAVWQTFTHSAAAGTSDDVSTELTGKVSGGGVSTLGVVTSAPNNRCEIKDSSTDTYIEDAGGQRVYGRLTESVGVWTLSYYTNEAGVETAYSFSSTNIRVYFKEVFNQGTRPTFSDDLGLAGSLDLTADIIDASPTQRGVVNVSAQSFAGSKTFEAAAIFESSISTEREDVASTASIASLSSAKSFVKITGSTVTSILGIDAGTDGQKISVYNGTNTTVTLQNEDAGATAADRLILFASSPLILQARQSQQFVYDSGQSRWVQDGGSGSGSGSGFGINFIENGDGVSTVGWNLYDDGSAIPVDGTGGSPSVTIAVNNSNPILGGTDLRFSKPAGNLQGEGVSYDFSIGASEGFENRLTTISFELTASASFLTGISSDIRVYVYDVDNAQLLTPVRNYFLTNKGQYLSTFQTTDSENYRLILHVATTNAAAYDFSFKFVVVGPGKTLTGPAVSDSQENDGFDPQNFGTVTAKVLYSRQVGDHLEVYGRFNVGTPAGVDASILFPEGLEIDTAKLPTATNGTSVGYWHKQSATTSGTYTLDKSGVIFYDGTLSDSLFFDYTDGATQSSYTKQNADDMADASDGLNIFFRVPIKGWSSDQPVFGLGHLRLSDILAAGTNVTATPANLGEFRTLIKDSLAQTFSDNAPGTAPTSADGIRIYSTNGTGAGTSGQTNRVEAFIGYNKSWAAKFYSAAGRVGQVSTNFALDSGGTSEYGLFTEYNDSTGIITVSLPVVTSSYNRFVGYESSGGTDSWQSANQCYFDILFADNEHQVQLQDLQRHVFFRDLKADGTNGGDFFSGSWQTRELNTVENNQPWVKTFASNQILLTPGTYLAEASAPAFGVNQHKTRLYDVTNSVLLVLGQNKYAPGSDNIESSSTLSGVFTLASDSLVELQHRCNSTNTTNGLGVACAFGIEEQYAYLKITKIGNA